jgi:UDP-glucose 4-epimerase
MRVLVTGGAGYIGSTVSNLLLDLGHEVTIIDNLSRGIKKNVPKQANFYKMDISNKKKLNIIFSEKKIDLVIHFAAYINTEESIKYPNLYLKNNYFKAKTFIECCIKNNVKDLYSHLQRLFMEIKINL